MTHLATADGDLDFVAAQLAVFAPFADELQRRVGRLRIHAANSAANAARAREPFRHGALRHRALRL